MSPQSIFKSIKKIYFALLFSSIFFFLAAIYFSGRIENRINDQFISILFSGVLLMIIATSQILGGYAVKRKIANIASEKFLRTKMLEYLKIKVVEYALYEVSIIFSVLSMLLFESSNFAIISLLLLLLFLLKKPTSEKIIEDLSLSREEADEIYKAI